MNYTQYKNQMQKNSSSNSNYDSRPYVGYLSLKEGEEAVVRVMCDNVDELEVYPLHWVNVGGRNTWVKCPRNPEDSTQKCPYCSEDKPLNYRVFIKVIQYVTDEEGKVKSLAKIWDRPASFIDILADRIADYGPLSDIVCKIRRYGSGTSTKYDLLPQTPNKYPDSIYVKRDNAFEGFNIVGHSIREIEESKEVEETNPFLKDDPATPTPNINTNSYPVEEQLTSNAQREEVVRGEVNSPVRTSAPEFSRPKRFY